MARSESNAAFSLEEVVVSRGKEYLVDEIDYESNTVRLTLLPPGLKGFATSANIRTTIDKVMQEEKREFEQVACGLGEVRVRRAIEGCYLRSPQGVKNGALKQAGAVPGNYSLLFGWVVLSGW